MGVNVDTDEPVEDTTAARTERLRFGRMLGWYKDVRRIDEGYGETPEY